VQQVHEWLWNAQVSKEVTSPQFAVLYALRAEQDIDQRTLASVSRWIGPPPPRY